MPDTGIGNLTTKLIVALHPSGANPLALPFNEKLGTLVRETFSQL